MGVGLLRHKGENNTPGLRHIQAFTNSEENRLLSKTKDGRRKVLIEMLSECKPMGATQLLELLEKNKIHLHRSTISRDLAFLRKQGMILFGIDKGKRGPQAGSYVYWRKPLHPETIEPLNLDEIVIEAWGIEAGSPIADKIMGAFERGQGPTLKFIDRLEAKGFGPLLSRLKNDLGLRGAKIRISSNRKGMTLEES